MKVYATIPHNLLIQVLSDDIIFSFKLNSKSHWLFKYIKIYWTIDCGRYFTRQSLVDVILFLSTKCYFTIGNLVFQEKIGISMGKVLVPYWTNLFLYFFESKYVQQLIYKRPTQAYKFHGTPMFIKDLFKINDDGEFPYLYKYT